MGPALRPGCRLRVCPRFRLARASRRFGPVIRSPYTTCGRPPEPLMMLRIIRAEARQRLLGQGSDAPTPEVRHRRSSRSTVGSDSSTPGPLSPPTAYASTP